MRYTILFIIALISVSGFIAYFGDILGRRMGKRRLTLFGMRPKYTAIVVTTITGMLISGIALLTLVTVNSQFKRVLTHGEQIIEQNRVLTSSNAGLAKRNEALVSRSSQLVAEMELRRQEVDEARKKTVLAVAAEKKAKSVVARLEKEIASRKRELENVRRRNEAAVTELNLQTEELREVQGKLTSAQVALARAKADVVEAGDKLAATRDKLAQTQREVAVADRKLAEQGRALEEQNRILEEQHRLLVQVGREKIEFEQQASELRTRDLIFRRGDELARAVISSRQSAFGVRSDVFSLLRVASSKAEKDGAVLGSNGRAVNVVYRQNADDPYPLPLLESSCVDLAVDLIGTSLHDVLVRVVCARNTLSGEQVPVELRFYVNSRAYRSGELIASGRLDGRLSEGRILLAVMDFLQYQVGREAERAGIVPVAGGVSGGGQDQRVQVEALMTLVERIRQQESRVKVDVYAATDVYASGPLSMDKMRFEISAVR